MVLPRSEQIVGLVVGIPATVSIVGIVIALLLAVYVCVKFSKSEQRCECNNQ